MLKNIMDRIYNLFARKPDPVTKTGEKVKQLNTDEQTADWVAVRTQNIQVTDSDDKNIEQYSLNPDRLAQRKGIGIYDQMLLDDQLASLALLKKVARLATSFDVYAVDGSDKNRKIAEFVKWSLNNMDITIRTLIYNFLTSMDYGFSISEKVFQYYKDGPYKGYVGYKTIAPKSPVGIFFHRKPNGDLHDDGIVQLSHLFYSSDWQILAKRINARHPSDRRFRKKDFVIFSYNSRFRNPYGTSDFKASYRGWVSKDILMRYWNMYLERYGAPIPYAEIPVGTDANEVKTLQKIIANLQNKSSFTVPKDTTVKFLESERTATPGFEKAIGIYNGAMSRSSLVPDLMGFSGGFGTGGSYGLGKTQYDVFVMLLEYIGLNIEEEVFHKQIIKPLVDLNFKGVKDYPRFKFGTIKRETRKDRAQILQLLSNIGLIRETQEWMFNFCDLPIHHNQIEEGLPLLPALKHELDNAGLRRTESDERSVADGTETDEDLGRGDDRDA